MADLQPAASSMTELPASQAPAAGLSEANPVQNRPTRRTPHWRKHPVTRVTAGVVSAFFFALTVLPAYSVIAHGKNPIWLAYAVVAAVACYLCIADVVRQDTRTPDDEEEANRRFDAIARDLGRQE
jgi:hypothetical protein